MAEPSIPPLAVTYVCEATHNTVAVVTDHADVQLAHMLVMIERITQEQYLALLASIDPEFMETGQRFLVECFGRGV